MNKPVAWRIGMQTPNDGIKYIYVDSEKDMDFLNRNSPNPYDASYTHPVKEQELLDEIRNLNIENADLKAKLQLLKAVWL